MSVALVDHTIRQRVLTELPDGHRWPFVELVVCVFCRTSALTRAVIS